MPFIQLFCYGIKKEIANGITRRNLFIISMTKA